MTTPTTEPASASIGGLKLRSPVLVAPMVGITDAPFRQLCHELGAGLVTAEMTAAEAVVRRVPAAMRLLDFPPSVHPVAAQIVGCDPATMAEAARICVESGADIVDVNLGCPVRKVVGRGSGAALARDIDATARVLGAMVAAVDVPVTAKMRLGWDHESINAPELARALADVGVAAVTVHGRTRCQGYAGRADWEAIAHVHAAVDIPVFASGDVTDPVGIANAIDAGRVDGVVVARGMLGDYFVLQRTATLLATGELLPEPTFSSRVDLARRHVAMLIDYYGETRALKLGRKYVAWTIKGCAGAARLRAMVQDLDSRERLDQIWDLALAAGLGPEGWFRPMFISGEG